MVARSKLENILSDSPDSKETASNRAHVRSRGFLSGAKNSIAAYVAAAIQAFTPAAAPAAPAVIATAAAVGTAITMTAREAHSHPEERFQSEWQDVLELYRHDGFAPTQAASDHFTRFINRHHDRVSDFSTVTPLLYMMVNGQNLYVDVQPADSDLDAIRTVVRRNFPAMSPDREAHVLAAGQAYGDGIDSGYDSRSRLVSHGILERMLSAYLLFDAPAPSASGGEHTGVPCGPRPACSDGIDNDGDGNIDHADRGCYEGDMFNPQDDDESESAGCSDGIDNDGDGQVDHLDRDCYENGRFNPQGSEGSADCRPAECSVPGRREGPPMGNCIDGIDNDGDGQVDHLDRDCYIADRFNPRLNEEPRPPQCSDGGDNDRDGDVDHQDAECYTPDGMFHPDHDSESRAPAGRRPATTEAEDAEPSRERRRERTPRGPRRFSGGVGFQGALHATDTPLDWYQAGGQLVFLHRGEHGLADVILMYGVEEMDFSQAMELGTSDAMHISHNVAGVVRYDSEPFTLEVAGGWIGTHASSGYSTPYGPTTDGSSSERVVETDPETGEEVVIGDQYTEVRSEGTHEGETTTPWNPDWFTSVEGRFRLTDRLFLRAGATVFGSRYGEDSSADSHDLNTTDTVYDSVDGFDPAIHVERTDRTATDTHVDVDAESTTIGGGARLGMGGYLGDSNVTLEGDIVVTHAGTEGAVDATTDTTVVYTGGHEVVVIDGERDEDYIEGGVPDSVRATDHVPIGDAVTVVNPSLRVTLNTDTILVASRLGVPISIEQRLEHVTDIDEEGHEVPRYETDDDGDRAAVMEENTYVHVPEWAVSGYALGVGVTPTLTWGAGVLGDGRSLTLSGLISSAGDREGIQSSPWAAYLSRAYESELLGLAPDVVRRESLASHLRHIIASQPGITGMFEFTAEADSDAEGNIFGNSYAFGGRGLFSYLGQTEGGSRFGLSLEAGISGNPDSGDIEYDAALNFLAGRGGFYFVGGPFVAGDTEVSDIPIVGGQLYFMVLPDALFRTHTTSTADRDEEEPEAVAMDDYYTTF